jgi:hypothetical protein
MLTLDGEPLQDVSVEALLRSPTVEAANAQFLSQPQLELPAGTRGICVLQGEAASVPLPSGASEARLTIGSEDATTCAIAVLLSRSHAWAAHLDSSSCSDSSALQRAFAAFTRPEPEPVALYLAGCYEEPSGVGRRVAQAVLQLFHALSPWPLELRLCCVGAANTTPAGAPRSRQLVVDCSTGAAFPHTFADRGPCIPRRMAANWCLPLRLLRELWDPAGCLVLPAMPTRLSAAGLQYCATLLAMGERELLRDYSTSPDHEGPKFVPGGLGAWRW